MNPRTGDQIELGFPGPDAGRRIGSAGGGHEAPGTAGMWRRDLDPQNGFGFLFGFPLNPI